VTSENNLRTQHCMQMLAAALLSVVHNVKNTGGGCKETVAQSDETTRCHCHRHTLCVTAVTAACCSIIAQSDETTRCHCHRHTVCVTVVTAACCSIIAQSDETIRCHCHRHTVCVTVVTVAWCSINKHHTHHQAAPVRVVCFMS
jgi:hypothetical protein